MTFILAKNVGGRLSDAGLWRTFPKALCSFLADYLYPTDYLNPTERQIMRHTPLAQRFLFIAR